MSKIKIILNGEEFLFSKEKTVADLVERLELDVAKIAIEKNYEIIAIDSFEKSIVQNGDKIEIVSFIGGG